MKDLLEQNKLILMEAAIVERLRRSSGIELHPTLVHAPLVYDDSGRGELEQIYQSYIDVARDANKPILLCSPTWRTNHERVVESGIDRNINVDAVQFLHEIRDKKGVHKSSIKIGGLIGCKQDCYKPEQGLSQQEAEVFHAWQITELVKAKIDFLIAETLPNVQEAIGIANVMARTGLPYIISFVINRNAQVLDGTPLLNAMEELDGSVNNKPLGFMVNCAYPTFLTPALAFSNKETFSRLIGYLANASALDHSALDNSNELHAEDITLWGDEMLKLNRKYGIKILGGCCGTDVGHLRYLVKNNN